MIFVTSWDDGHPLDERIADMLERVGLKGTFFLPIRNREGRPVLSPDAMRRLDGRFEIGSHTLDHAYLTRLPQADCQHQIVDGKDCLEQIVGHRVEGFCYPGGKLNARVKRAVSQAGFAYARTIESLRMDCGEDRYAVPTTLQFYPHRRSVILRNFLRHTRYGERFPAMRLAISGSGCWDSLIRLLEASATSERVIHIWGHSWEIEEQGLWSQLQTFLAAVAAMQPQACSVSDVMCKSEKV